MPAGCHVELPTMPGTSDHIAVEFTFGKRAAGVRTDSIKGVKFAVAVEHGNNPPFDDKFSPFSVRDFRNRSDGNSFHNHFS